MHNRSLALILSLFGMLFSLQAYATTQKGLSLELGVGYPQYSLSSALQNGKYSGVSAQGRVLFPLLSSGHFSMDLDVSYQYTSLENNSSNAVLSEWAHLNNFGSGLRFNYSFLFVGVEYLFSKGKHVRAGTSNQIFEYDFNPIQWQAGLALSVSPVTSIVVSYSQMLGTNVSVGGSQFEANDQVLWLRFQIDFGVSFFNLLAPEESFKTTRGSFFIRQNQGGR